MFTQQEEFKIAITGDAIINRRMSIYSQDRFVSLINIIRDADVGFTHLETVIHDYEGPEVYPAADGGRTWMRSPRFVADELKWAGFKIVSHASNHCVDYSYGGLMSTWKALEKAGIAYAGTGKNLAEAREPAYLDTGKGRVALVSMCSSFARWARAGETRRDVKGRPGLNPLRFYYLADLETLETLKQVAMKIGWWVTKIGKQWLFNPAGLSNTVYKVVEWEGRGVSTAAEEEDADGNLASIRDAKRHADYVLVQLHTHEWDPAEGLHRPPKFVPPFARACVDAGADVFIGEGSHAPLRGIELYKNKPIFYDPGDFIGMNQTVTRLPSDPLSWPGFGPEFSRWEATPGDYYDARTKSGPPLYPPGGYFSARVKGSVIGVCSFKNGGQLAGVKLYPLTRISEPLSRVGVPLMAEPETGRKIIEYLGEISSPFGTKIEYKDGIGIVNL